MAAAIGARLPITEPSATLVIDIAAHDGDSLISLGGVVTWKSLPIAGEALNKNIVQFAATISTCCSAKRSPKASR